MLKGSSSAGVGTGLPTFSEGAKDGDVSDTRDRRDRLGTQVDLGVDGSDSFCWDWSFSSVLADAMTLPGSPTRKHALETDPQAYGSQ